MTTKFKFCKVLLQVSREITGVYPGRPEIDDIKRDAVRALQTTMQPGVLVREVDNYTVADRVYNIALDSEQKRVLQLQSQRGK